MASSAKRAKTMPKCPTDLHTLRASDSDLDAFAGHVQRIAADRVSASHGDLRGPGLSRVLVTGSSGYLGAALVATLRKCHIEVVGIDIVPSCTTDTIGSVEDNEIVRQAAQGCDAIMHTAALHAPHSSTYDEESFKKVNVDGTASVLNVARTCSPRSAIVVHTSTTSLTITPYVLAEQGEGKCVWISADSTHPRTEHLDDTYAPRNTYGRTKLEAERLCLKAASDGLVVVMLRLGRCFPEDALEKNDVSCANLKANELLGRRVALEDAVDAHLRALVRAQDVSGSIYVLSSPWPWTQEKTPTTAIEVAKLITEKYPESARIFDKLGWKLPSAISRIYDTSTTVRDLDWRPFWTFGQLLKILEGADSTSIDARLGRF